MMTVLVAPRTGGRGSLSSWTRGIPVAVPVPVRILVLCAVFPVLSVITMSIIPSVLSPIPVVASIPAVLSSILAI